MRLAIAMVVLGSLLCAQTGWSSEEPPPGEAAVDRHGAQTVAAPPDPEMVKRAERRIEQARRFRAKGEYDRAIEEYLAALVLVPQASNLYYNLAEVYRLKGDKKKALGAYEQYVTAKPDGSRANEARVFIAKLRADLGLEEGVAKPAVVPPLVAPKPREPEPLVTVAPVTPPAPPPVEVPPKVKLVIPPVVAASVTDGTVNAKQRRLWTGVGIAIGAVAVGAGLGIGLGLGLPREPASDFGTSTVRY